MVTCNAQPYSKHDWHWRLLVAHRFGHGAAVPAVHLALKLLDDAGLAGELVLREVRTGRAEVVQMWGRTESVRQEFKKHPRAVAARSAQRARRERRCRTSSPRPAWRLTMPKRASHRAQACSRVGSSTPNRPPGPRKAGSSPCSSAAHQRRVQAGDAGFQRVRGGRRVGQRGVVAADERVDHVPGQRRIGLQRLRAGADDELGIGGAP